MRKWAELMKDLNVYDPNNDIGLGVNIAKNMSPLTEIFLDNFLNICNEKNIIVTIPDVMLRTIPLISYTYSSIFKKSTLVFTSSAKGLDNKSIKDIHNYNYCLLNRTGSYLFYEIMIGYISNQKLESKITLPLAKRNMRRKIIENLGEVFFYYNDPKVLLFSGKDMDIISRVNELILNSNKSVKKEFFIDIGYVIFENVDYFINSEYTARKFIEWLKLFSLKGIKFLFHFSNPQSKFIDILAEELDSEVLSFNNSFLKNNNFIYNSSKEYFERSESKSFIKNLNIDKPSFYNELSNIEVLDPPLKKGTLDYHFYEAEKLKNNINIDALKNERLYYRSINILNYFRDFIVNPSKVKLSFQYLPGDWRTYSIPDFLKWFKSSLNRENDLNQFILDQYINKLFNIYYELSQCKRFGEKNSFNRLAKDYTILELLSHCDNEKNYVVASYFRTEGSILSKQLLEFDFENKDNISVKYIGWLNESNWDRSKYNLILPGPVPNKFKSELLQPYESIFILAYDGYNLNRVNQQIEEIIYHSKEEELKTIAYLNKINEHYKTLDKSIFYEYDKVPTLEEIKKEIIEDLTNQETTEKNDELEQIVQHIHQEKESIDKHKDIKSRTFILFNSSTGNTYTRKLYSNKTFFYINKKKDNFEEGSPDEFKKGDYIVLLDNDAKKSLIDLSIEIFGFNDSVNRELISYWKEKLLFYIKKNKMPLKSFNEKYVEVGGDKSLQATSLWAKGKVLAPLDPHDLYLIGKIIDDEIILDNYQLMADETNKIRNLHRVTGRKLNKIIKRILRGDEISMGYLSFDEHIFYEKIKDGFYEIIDIVD